MHSLSPFLSRVGTRVLFIYFLQQLLLDRMFYIIIVWFLQEEKRRANRVFLVAKVGARMSAASGSRISAGLRVGGTAQGWGKRTPYWSRARRSVYVTRPILVIDFTMLILRTRLRWRSRLVPRLGRLFKGMPRCRRTRTIHQLNVTEVVSRSPSQFSLCIFLPFSF